MDLTPIISLQGINKTYRKKTIALKEIDLTISRQEIVGIIGANGSGKSTLLKIIAGKLRPEKGSTTIFQLDIQKHNEQLKSKTSYISQEKALDPEMTGKETLVYFSALYGLSGKEALHRTTELIDTFEMKEFINRRIKSYSGGQAQRLHLALGVIHQPQLLLLDEPTSALDPSGKKFFWEFIQAYQKLGNTILIVSHELEHISQYCSQILILDQGTLMVEGTVEEIIQSYSTPVLHIKSTGNLENITGLSRLLTELFPSAKIKFNQGMLRLVFSMVENINKPNIFLRTLQFIVKQKLPITECRWENDGLENAHFRLTGQHIIQPSRQKNNRKGKRGKNEI